MICISDLKDNKMIKKLCSFSSIRSVSTQAPIAEN